MFQRGKAGRAGGINDPFLLSEPAWSVERVHDRAEEEAATSISIAATTASHRKLFHRFRKWPRTTRRTFKRAPTFLLLEGLDGARVVHHCDVQLASSRIACVRKSNCGARGEKLRCGCVGVLSAPILPDGLTADAQSEATPVSAPQDTPPPSSAPHRPRLLSW